MAMKKGCGCVLCDTCKGTGCGHCAGTGIERWCETHTKQGVSDLIDRLLKPKA